jgi:hypothetical protein
MDQAIDHATEPENAATLSELRFRTLRLEDRDIPR